MKLNATPETVRAVGKALELAALLDDRVGHSDPARVAAWSEQVQRHGLREQDLLDGVQAFYDSPSERAIQVGDLIHHSRQVRRARNAAEQETHQRRIAAAGDQKAADDIAAVARAFVPGKAPDTPRLKAARDALQGPGICDRETAMAAMRELFAAKAEAKKTAPISKHQAALASRQRAAAPPAAMEEK